MFYIPTGTTEAFDTCDIVFVVSSGNNACNVTFGNGATIRVAASIADFVAEINALYPPALPLLLGPGPTPDGREGALAARRVQRVQPRNGIPGESFVTMDALGFAFVIPLPVPDVVTLLNATSSCDGGGGGGGTFLDAGTYTGLVLTPGADNAVSLLNTPTFMRAGQASQAPNAAPGDIVTVKAWVQAIVQDGAKVDFTITGLPADVVGSTLWQDIEPFVTVGDLQLVGPPAPPARGAPFVFPVNATTVGVGTTQTVVGLTIVQMRIEFSYAVA